MKNPQPIHLSTDEYFAGLGWAAVARDADGHAVSCHAKFENEAERRRYLVSEAKRGCTVTMLPAPVAPEVVRAAAEAKP
jgi:predicted kinase